MGVALPNFRLTFSAVCAILPLSAQLLLWGFADAAYPREGTVTQTSISMCWSSGCSLSPRGDGYAIAVSRSESREDAAYPREGTVTLYVLNFATTSSDAAYPREGTVTHRSRSKCRCRLMQLSPARGRLR